MTTKVAFKRQNQPHRNIRKRQGCGRLDSCVARKVSSTMQKKTRLDGYREQPEDGTSLETAPSHANRLLCNVKASNDHCCQLEKHVQLF